jgi:hypothetical protein
MTMSRRLMLGAAVTLMAGCGKPQTLIPYTPAAGVNNGPRADLPNPGDDTHVDVRNLLVVATAPGTGFLSGTIIAKAEPVTLRDVSGAPIKTGGALGTAFVVSGGTSVAVPARKVVVLTETTAITLKSSDLVAGGTAEITLSFDKGVPVRLKVPVYASTMPEFATITPKK